MTTDAGDIRALGSVVDSHMHLWGIDDDWMKWLHDERDWMPVIGRDFTMNDGRDAMDLSGVSRAVLVETGLDRRENERLLSVARSVDWVAGVVLWIDFSSRRSAQAAIASQAAGESIVVGARHWEGNPKSPISLRDAGAFDAVETLAAAGLTLDFFSADFRDLELVARLTREIEGLRIVVNHLGKPKIADPSAFDAWARNISVLADSPNVSFKYSGWATRVARITADQVRPYISFLLARVGADRIMFASNWPVSLTVGDYDETAFASYDGLDMASERERQRVFCESASLAYPRLALP